jgi:hypothetical protein
MFFLDWLFVRCLLRCLCVFTLGVNGGAVVHVPFRFVAHSYVYTSRAHAWTAVLPVRSLSRKRTRLIVVNEMAGRAFVCDHDSSCQRRLWGAVRGFPRVVQFFVLCSLLLVHQGRESSRTRVPAHASASLSACGIESQSKSCRHRLGCAQNRLFLFHKTFDDQNMRPLAGARSRLLGLAVVATVPLLLLLLLL